jgi:hypothetical protein
MSLTPLQAERLRAAVQALRAAGATHLPERLERVFASDDDAAQADVLVQARSFASIVHAGADPVVHLAALDAVGLLWATLEMDEFLGWPTAAAADERTPS